MINTPFLCFKEIIKLNLNSLDRAQLVVLDGPVSCHSKAGAIFARE